MKDWKKTEEALGYKVIKIDDMEIKTQLTIGMIPDYIKREANEQAELQLLTQDDKLTSEHKTLKAKKILSDSVDFRTKFMFDIISAANKDVEDSKINMLIENNYTELLTEIKIAYKLAKREDLKAIEKKEEAEKN